MTPKTKKIIIGIIVLIVVFVGYAILKPDPTADVLVTNRNSSTTAVSSQQARALGAQISQALLKIDQITLDRGVFDNSIFKSLEDRSQTIDPEPIGRSNPFAPLGDVSVNTAIQNTPDITSATSSSSTSSTSTSSVRVNQ